MSCQLIRKWSRLQGRVRGQAVPQNMLLIVELGNEALLCCVVSSWQSVHMTDRERGAATCRHEPPTWTQQRTHDYLFRAVGQAGKGLMTLQVMNMRHCIISGQFNYRREVLGFEVNGSSRPFLPPPTPPPQQIWEEVNTRAERARLRGLKIISVTKINWICSQ